MSLEKQTKSLSEDSDNGASLDLTSTILAKDNSLLSHGKPFSLISDISDRSVSLESIPSVGIFSPSVSHESSNQIGGITSPPGKDTSEVTTVRKYAFTDVSSDSRIAVIGSKNIPQSLLLHLKNPPLFTPPSCHQNVYSLKVNNESEDGYKSKKRLGYVAEAEEDIDTDTDTELSESIPKDGQSTLERGDTLILPTSEEGANVVIPSNFLGVEPEGKKLHLDINSISEIIPSTSEHNYSGTNLIETENSNEHTATVHSRDSAQTENSSQFEQISLTLQTSDSSLSSNNIFLDLKNGQTPMIRCETGDLLDISGLLQKGVDNVSFISSQPSSIPVLSEPLSKQTTAKETQTEIVLGNRETPFHETRLVLTLDCNRCDANTFAENQTTRKKEEHKLLSCSICKKSFKSRQDLKNHSKEHTSEKIFKCDLCNTTFTRMGNFTRHRKIHDLQAEVCKVNLNIL